jgi:hypothetical protein
MPSGGSYRSHPCRTPLHFTLARNGDVYFFRRAAERFADRKEIPERIAFCWTAAAVRPSFLAI